MIDSPYLVRPGRKLRLSEHKPHDTGPFKHKQQTAELVEKHLRRLQELHDVLYARAKNAVLIVLQAMDTGGKDGAIRHVFSGVNPQGCIVTSFKAPNSTELAHDYLWRIHAAVPPRGTIGIFNRSHYESVLIERVKNLVPKSVWSQRYGQINDFERMLGSEGVTLIKFFLHISRDEQKQRLQERLDDPTKHWKFNPQDLVERKLWDQYMRAYERAMEQCSTEQAPWYIVPSDKKWFRNWVISDIIVKTMEKMDLKYPKAIKGLKKYKVK